jgi:3-hydroxyacyl-CoA dehydrogenase/enoyl-CoA hydratase/3-hydroxybutyryl-CoA epimerase
VEYTGFGRANLVIEAVFEDLVLKQRVLREVEPLLRDDAIYASNTSTIPISHIAEAAARPNRVLGMHFFSPVHKMPLLEVIATGETDDDAIVTAVAYGKQLGKTVIVVNDSPGFYTTRILSAYMNEAGRLLDEGASVDAVDAPLLLRLPVGPITLLDEVGIDVGGKVGQVLHEAFGARMSPSDSLRRRGVGAPAARGEGFTFTTNEKKSDVDPSVYEVLPGGVQRRGCPHARCKRDVCSRWSTRPPCVSMLVLRSTVEGCRRGIRDQLPRSAADRSLRGRAERERVLDDLELLNERFPGGSSRRRCRAACAAAGRFYPARGNPMSMDD